MKKIAIVWTITIIVIVGGLTIFGFAFKRNNIGDISEESLIREAKKYLGMYPSLFPVKGEELRLTSEKLKDEGYDPGLETDCEGYVIITNGDMGYAYEPFVKCPDYVTKGYSKE